MKTTYKTASSGVLDGLEPALGWVLMLAVGSTLPGVNGISAENVQNFVANFKVRTVTEEFIHGTFFA